VFIDNICSWLYSFASEIETLGQEEMHLHQLNLFISQSVDATEAVRTATNHFVNVLFLNVLHKICFRHYYRLIGGDVKTTSFVESYNSVYIAARTDLAPISPL
jgi:protein-disulfide isomerase-like protein with CxxC motif